MLEHAQWDEGAPSSSAVPTCLSSLPFSPPDVKFSTHTHTHKSQWNQCQIHQPMEERNEEGDAEGPNQSPSQRRSKRRSASRGLEVFIGLCILFFFFCFCFWCVCVFGCEFCQLRFDSIRFIALPRPICSLSSFRKRLTLVAPCLVGWGVCDLLACRTTLTDSLRILTLTDRPTPLVKLTD